MSITAELVKNVVETGFESLDTEYIEKAKLRILDTLGCAMAGAETAGCRGMLELVRRWGGAGESTLIVHGGKFPAHNAAAMNSLMARSLDFEPVEAEGENNTSPAHISGTTIPSALAVAEQQAASGKELITALVIGDDIASRLGVSSGYDFKLGWDNTGTFNVFGAAAIAAKLLRLNEKQVFNAFGIALNQLSGSVAVLYDKTMSFKLNNALSARNGIFSAELAGEGFAGVKEPFMGPRGYFALFCPNHTTEDLTRDIGKKFYADCVIKPYSACRATHLSIDSALQIARRNTCKADEIGKITVEITPGVLETFVGQPFTPGETPQVDGVFSIRYTVATALIRKDVRPEHFSDECLNDPLVKTLIDKMELRGSIAPGQVPAARVRVEMKNGQIYTGQADFALGDFRMNPLSTDRIKAKYLANMAYSGIVSPQRAEQILKTVERLEELRDMHELTSLLVK
ncbi:MAG: MmgE/PrpD family protein [Dehalococcoidales bacterium]|nr:MmgE/PrpD family protein [Dehalococcoidales bacterium]